MRNLCTYCLTCFLRNPDIKLEILNKILSYLCDQKKYLEFWHRLKVRQHTGLALKRIEELLPLVNDNTPEDDPHYLELDMISDMVEEY